MYLGCANCKKQNTLGGFFDQGINVITGSNAWQSVADTLTHATEGVTKSPAFEAMVAPAAFITAPIIHAAQVTYDNPIVHTIAAPITGVTEV